MSEQPTAKVRPFPVMRHADPGCFLCSAPTSEVICAQCKHERGILSAKERSAQIRRQTGQRMWWRRIKRGFERLEFALFLLVSLTGMGLTAYCVYLLIRWATR